MATVQYASPNQTHGVAGLPSHQFSVDRQLPRSDMASRSLQQDAAASLTKQPLIDWEWPVSDNASHPSTKHTDAKPKPSPSPLSALRPTSQPHNLHSDAPDLLTPSFSLDRRGSHASLSSQISSVGSSNGDSSASVSYTVVPASAATTVASFLSRADLELPQAGDDAVGLHPHYAAESLGMAFSSSSISSASSSSLASHSSSSHNSSSVPDNDYRDYQAEEFAYNGTSPPNANLDNMSTPPSVKRPNLSLYTDPSTLNTGWSTSNGSSSEHGQAGLPSNSGESAQPGAVSSSMSSGHLSAENSVMFQSPNTDSTDARRNYAYSANSSSAAHSQPSASASASASVIGSALSAYSAIDAAGLNAQGFGNAITPQMLAMMQSQDRYNFYQSAPADTNHTNSMTRMASSDLLHPESAVDQHSYGNGRQQFHGRAGLNYQHQQYAKPVDSGYMHGSSPISPGGSAIISPYPNSPYPTSELPTNQLDSAAPVNASGSYFDAMLLGAQHLQRQEEEPKQRQREQLAWQEQQQYLEMEMQQKMHKQQQQEQILQQRQQQLAMQEQQQAMQQQRLLLQQRQLQQVQRHQQQKVQQQQDLQRMQDALRQQYEQRLYADQSGHSLQARAEQLALSQPGSRDSSVGITQQAMMLSRTGSRSSLNADDMRDEGFGRSQPVRKQLHNATLQSWARLPARPESDAEAHAILKPYITEYLETSNKLMLGERTVVVMSTTVGQKSYGSERRFLVPPPSAFILGCSWWTHLPDAYIANAKRHFGSTNPAIQLLPPSVQVSMTHDHRSVSDTSLEWTTIAGGTVDKIASAEDFSVAGRVVGKQLFIPDFSKELKKARSNSAFGMDKPYDPFQRPDIGDAETNAKRDSVQAEVKIIAPGLGPDQDRVIGSFLSAPIKIISKPTKKVQNTARKASQYVTHGGTVALFSRLRSQTVSTRFLCVSSAAASFPQADWQSMTGQEEKPFSHNQQSSFIARTSAWDSFVIYAVDPRRPAIAEEDNGQVASQPGYPQPPNNALPVATTGCPMPIYYNQPVILQCLNTAVVSPVMLVRRVDKGNIAIGGGKSDGASAHPGCDLPAAPGEALGDPVAQLHRIALEVMPDPTRAYETTDQGDNAGFEGCGSFLSCLGENVGVRKSDGPRLPYSQDSSPNPGGSPGDEDDNPFESGLQASRAVDMNRGRSTSVSTDAYNELAVPITNDGGKVKKARRLSTVTSSPLSTPMRNRKRGASTSSLLTELPEDDATGSWQQDAGEAGCWTIASTEIARHTFYIPPVLFSGLVPYKCKATGCPDCFLTPIPTIPIGNLPSIKSYLVSNPAVSNPRRQRTTRAQRAITLYGENFGPEWTVWFGDIPSPGRSESACPDSLECLEPVDDALDTTIPRQLLLVRSDGVIVPSNVYWPSA